MSYKYKDSAAAAAVRIAVGLTILGWAAVRSAFPTKKSNTE